MGRLEIVEGLAVPHRAGFELYDTTLRDGQQGIEASFSVSGKLRVARRIHSSLPVTQIEGGWPGANPTDTEFFKRAQDEPFHGMLAAFGMTRRANIGPEDDAVLKDLLNSNAPIITFVGKTDILHVTNVFRIPPEENLAMIEDSVRYAREQGRRVIYDAEHFFDGADRDPDYAMATLHAAARGGAETLVLCDTNGGKFPWEVERWVHDVIHDEKLNGLYREAVQSRDPDDKIKIGIHTHSDRKSGETNALYAVRAGATHVQGTIGGIGERAGNADLLVLTDGLADMGYVHLTPEQQHKFVELGTEVLEAAGIMSDPRQPLIGEHVFATKAGMHQDATLKFPHAYAFKPPESYGNHSTIVISNQSGRRAVRERMNQLGIPTSDETILNILSTVKNLENQGYNFVKGSASLELLMRRHDPSYRSPFEVVYESGNKESGASVRLSVSRNDSLSDSEIHDRAEITPIYDNGNVGDAFEQLRGALQDSYPSVKSLHFLGYQTQKEDEFVRVYVKLSDGAKTWTTMGVDKERNIAEFKAVSDSLEYCILHAKPRPTA